MTDNARPVNAATRPVALVPKLENIPTELRQRHGWVVWRYVWDQKRKGIPGKWRKPPFNPATGQPASVTDAATWRTFEAAVALFKASNYDGIGLVLDDERLMDNNRTLYALDIDHCRDPQTGVIDDEAMAIIVQLDSFAEVSPSGEGVHVWFMADLAVTGKRVGRWELYAADRYLTVTGHLLGDRPGPLVDRQEQGERLLRDVFKVREQADSPQPVTRSFPIQPTAMPDDEVFRRCCSDAAGPIFRELYEGGNGSHKSNSEADLSFCTRLAFYTQDAAQIIRVWSGSGRWRDKCESHPDYAQRTAEKAIKTRASYYDPNFRKGKPNGKTAALKVTPPEENPPPVYVSPTTTRPTTSSSSDDGFTHGTKIKPEAIRFFVKPWIVREDLNFLCGGGGCGKSTLLAYCVSKAERAVMFTGNEESVASKLVPRLLAHGVDLDKVTFVDGSRWTFPNRADEFADRVKAIGADLVTIDPVDSYMDAGIHENDDPHVRAMLESLIRVARKTGAAVVAVRHPGKDPANICPGARSWRNVPRNVVQLLVDNGKPQRRFMHMHKDSHGSTPPDTYYELVDQGKNKPKLFRFGGEVSAGLSEIAQIVTDRGERRKIDMACDLIKDWLSAGRVEVPSLMAAADKMKISGSTMHLAADLLGVKKTRDDGAGLNRKFYWEKPEKWPD